MEYLWVGIGGGVGAISRFVVGKQIARLWGTSFPYGTLVINLTGALIIGFLLTLLTERTVSDPFWRLLLVTGFLGGYTTFSSYTYESMQLIQDGRWGAGLLYVGGSNLAGLLCCAAGMAIARSVFIS
jgi:CrcB protein